MGFFGDLVKTFATFAVSAVISIALPGGIALTWANVFRALGSAFVLSTLSSLANEFLVPKQQAPDLSASVTTTSTDAQFVIGRSRVPGVPTDTVKVDGRHYARDESNYILYTVMHHKSHMDQEGFHGFWFNNFKFQITGNIDPHKGKNFPQESGTIYGPFKYQMIRTEGGGDSLSDKEFNDLAADYGNHLEVYCNLTGDNSGNRSIPGTAGVIPDTSLPLSWVLLRIRDRKKFWTRPGVGMQPTSASFDLTGSEPNAATALRNFIIDNMAVVEGDIDEDSYNKAVEFCERENLMANGVWRHTTKESIYRSLLEAFNGMVAYEFGKWVFKPNRLVGETFQITEDMLVEPVEHKIQGDLDNYANIIQTEINNAEDDWKPSSTGQIVNQAALADDGQEFVSDLGALRLITDMKQAREYMTQSLARIGQYSELTLAIVANENEDRVAIFEVEVTDPNTGLINTDTVRVVIQ